GKRQRRQPAGTVAFVIGAAEARLGAGVGAELLLAQQPDRGDVALVIAQRIGGKAFVAQLRAHRGRAAGVLALGVGLQAGDAGEVLVDVIAPADPGQELVFVAIEMGACAQSPCPAAAFGTEPGEVPFGAFARIRVFGAVETPRAEILFQRARAPEDAPGLARVRAGIERLAQPRVARAGLRVAVAVERA